MSAAAELVARGPGDAAVRHHARRVRRAPRLRPRRLGAVLRRPARPARQRRAPRTPSTCAAGRSGCTTRSCSVVPTSSARRASASASARTTTSIAIEAEFDEPRLRHPPARRRPSRDGRARCASGTRSAFPLEFFHEMERFETQLQRFDLQRGAPVHAARPLQPAQRRRWRRRSPSGRSSASAAPSTSPRTAPNERLTGAWLTRKPTVHDLALTAGRGPRLHHLGFYVAEPARRAARVRPARGRRARGRDRARAGPARRLQRVLRLPTRPRRPPDRALLVRLLHRRSRPRAAALVGLRPPLPLVLGRERAGQLVRRIESSCSARTGWRSEPFEATVDERTARSDVMA